MDAEARRAPDSTLCEGTPCPIPSGSTARARPVRRHRRRARRPRGHARARRARGDRARPQRPPRDRPGRHRAARRACSCAMGQLVPCIGHRPDRDAAPVVLYAGQRRLLAARASHQLAGATGSRACAGAQPDRAAARPRALGADEIRRIQAQENQREDLTPRRPAGAVRRLLGRPRRPARRATGSPPSAPTSASAPARRHNLRRQLTLPEPIRARVAERPTERPALGHAGQPPRRHARASPPSSPRPSPQRITTRELHDAALRDLGAFVHRTIVEDEHAYAVRIDDGALLDAPTRSTTRPRAPHRRTAARASRQRARLRRPTSSTSELDALADARQRAAAPSCASTRRCASAPAPAATPTCTTAAPTSRGVVAPKAAEIVRKGGVCPHAPSARPADTPV